MLVAISIPVFSAQLEKAREATDVANMRSAYAECSAAVLGDTTKAYAKKVDIRQTKDGWDSNPEKFANTIDLTSDAVGSKLGETNSSVWVVVDQDGVTLATSKGSATDIDE